MKGIDLLDLTKLPLTLMLIGPLVGIVSKETMEGRDGFLVFSFFEVGYLLGKKE